LIREKEPVFVCRQDHPAPQLNFFYNLPPRCIGTHLACLLKIPPYWILDIAPPWHNSIKKILIWLTGIIPVNDQFCWKSNDVTVNRCIANRRVVIAGQILSIFPVCQINSARVTTNLNVAVSCGLFSVPNTMRLPFLRRAPRIMASRKVLYAVLFFIGLPYSKL